MVFKSFSNWSWQWKTAEETASNTVIEKWACKSRRPLHDTQRVNSRRRLCRRGGQWLTCRTHASLHGYGNVPVSVSIDKAHLQKDLRFEYVEDPSITKIEPEWSIYRCSLTASLCSLFHFSINASVKDHALQKKEILQNLKAWWSSDVRLCTCADLSICPQWATDITICQNNLSCPLDLDVISLSPRLPSTVDTPQWLWPGRTWTSSRRH